MFFRERVAEGGGVGAGARCGVQHEGRMCRGHTVAPRAMLSVARPVLCCSGRRHRARGGGATAPSRLVRSTCTPWARPSAMRATATHRSSGRRRRERWAREAGGTRA
eukprot:3793160-Prymnesium_polylepis.1